MRHKVRSICVVSKCELWIGTHQFITVLNTNNPELSIYQPESWMAHKNSSVNSIVVVNEDQIWSCGNTEINIWNNKKQKLRCLKIHKGKIRNLCLANTSVPRVWSCCNDGYLALWDTQSLECMSKIYLFEPSEDKKPVDLRFVVPNSEKNPGKTYVVGKKNLKGYLFVVKEEKNV
eukprot:TRINITY_DN2956_c0_g1_i17.p1 TRINITY_DN2956_c0_g1~~TRINITY_DN2956_c0_g1_i17.p1  ORF type:complete len:175 (-),score=16.22 TRINITY_DN2956_c0_g1_i17:426-950(-)